MAIDYSKVKAEEESVKQEESFFISAFSNTYKYTDLQALALKLQDLLLMEKGTNPSAMGMGVGIKNYLFEFMDTDTITTMTNEINQQQKKYIPSGVIKSLEFYKNSKSAEDKNKLYLFVHINKVSDYAVDYFVIGVKANGTNTIVVNSDIYL